MAKQENVFVQFTHESKFDVSRFDEYLFDEDYEGAIFSTCHNGVGYKWRLFIQPNGGNFTTKLKNGKWSAEQKDHENVRYGLELLEGPLSSISVDHSLEVKASDRSAEVLHKFDLVDCLFDSDSRWTGLITTKLGLEKDESFANGVLRVVVEVKMSLELFDPVIILQKLKQQISLEQENITAVPSFLFDSIETQPTYGLCLSLICGAEKHIFYCVAQVLENNSAYFRNLLNCSGDFKEKKESKIEYRDKDPEGVRAALRYIYLKELPENFEQVAEVCLPAAHLFLLPSLVMECERVLIRNLTVENDVAMAVLAQTYDLTLLKNMAMNSMAMHFKDILDNSELKEKSGLRDEFVTLVDCRSRSAANGILKQNYIRFNDVPWPPKKTSLFDVPKKV